MFTKAFKQLSKNDANIAGGKGASLGEMINSGIPVPDGFVVLSTTFDKFLEITDVNIEIDAILKKVKHNEVHTVEKASKQIQALILKAEMPKEIAKEIKSEFKKLGSKYVAVRSSATAEDSASAAWAGQLDSFLNTTEDTLLENVQRCFASLFTPRAIFYRFEKELHDQIISVAVVVQKMVNSDVSGIAFSVHPVTEDRNQIIIEAGYGLGEAIVSGQITPDAYVVTKNDLNILDKNVYTQERGIFRDNKNGGNEWKDISEIEAKEQCLSDKQIIELSNLIIKIENHYNFPCDIEWAMEGSKFYIVQSRPITTLKEYKLENSINEQEVDIKKFKESIKDREYITQQGDISIALLGNICNAIQKEYISVYGYSHVQPILTMQKGTHGICYFDLEMYRDFSRLSYSRIKNSVYNLPEYKDYQKLSEIIDNEYKNFFISKNIMELKEKVSNYFELAKKYLVSTLFCEAVDHQIVRELAVKSGVKNIEKFIEISILPTKPSFVSHQNQLLLDDVDMSWSFTNYFATPTIKERLKLLSKKRKETNRKEIEKEIKKTRQTANNNQKSVDKLLRECSGEQKKLVEFVQASINVRDERKEFILKLFTILSDSLRSLAEKFNISYDLISTMADNEIERLGENSFFEILQERFEKGVAMISSSNKPLISAIDYDLSKSIVFDQSNKSDSVNGICANKGFYKGKVKIIVSEKKFHQFQDGEVLITGMTRAEYVPLMRKAGAIVTDEGGVTCHAAIVSRELGKPCIIGTRIATQVLKDGDEVEVDADNGVVMILKSKSENDDIKWVKTFSRKHSLQRMSFLWPYFKTGLIQDKNIKLNNLLVLPNEDRYDYYIEENEWNDCLEKLSKHLLKDSTISQKKYFENLAEKFLSVSKKVYSADLKKWTDKKMSNWFKNFLKIYSLYSWYVFTPFSLESKIYPELLEKLNKKYPKKVNEYLEIISTPIKNNQLLEQQLDLLKISLLENKDKELDKHIKKYFWIPVNNINDNPWNKKDFLEQIKQFKDAKSEIKKRKEDLQDRKNNFNQFLKKIRSNKDIYNLSRLINFYVSLRDDSRDVWRKVLCYINPFYIELARRASFRKDGAFNMLNEEIFDFLEIGKIPKDLSKRDKGHAVLFKNGDLKIIVDNSEINNLQKSLLKDNSSLELRGFSAYKGAVSGRVRLIKNKEDLKFLQDGEILVSHHTSPDYLLAMKKSIAFVTDEGGVTSHAAIVARELKIPCITATVNASSILKTGDEIEVDADNGVVRILKRK